MVDFYLIYIAMPHFYNFPLWKHKKTDSQSPFFMLSPTLLEALSKFFIAIRPPIVSLPYLHYSRALSEYYRSIYFTFITQQKGHPKVKRKEAHLTFFLTSCFLLVCLPYPCMESHSGCLSRLTELFLFVALSFGVTHSRVA